MGSMHYLIGGTRRDFAQIEIFEDYYFSLIFCKNLDGNSHQFKSNDFKNLVEISFISSNFCSISEQLTVEPSHNYNFKSWCPAKN